MKRTTIFADEGVLADVQEIARRENQTMSDVIRAALEEFVARRRAGGRVPSFVGIGRSGRKDVAARSEELLWTGPPRIRRK